MQRPANHLGRNNVPFENLTDGIDGNDENHHLQRHGRSDDQCGSRSEIRTEIRNDVENGHEQGQQQRIRQSDQPITDISQHPDNGADEDLPRI